MIIEKLSQVNPDIQFDTLRTEEHRQQLTELLCQGFGTKDFYADFPIWNSDYNGYILQIGAFYQNKLVASAGVRIAEMRTPKGRFRVGLIGGVVTSPDFQNQGLASQCVAIATRWAREQDSLIVFLWGSEHALYRRLGFELCGSQIRIPVRELIQSQGEDVKAIELREGYSLDLFELLKRKRVGGLVLNEQDNEWFANHKNVHWWTAYENGQAKAYAAFGRGIDLQGLVHEWGGDPLFLKKILTHILAEQPDAEILASPKHLETGALAQIISKECKPVEEYLCMAKVLSPIQIFKFYSTDLLGQVSASHKALEKFVLGHLKENEYAPYLFGVPDQKNFESQLLPFPIWIWGLDAV